MIEWLQKIKTFYYNIILSYVQVKGELDSLKPIWRTHALSHCFTITLWHCCCLHCGSWAPVTERECEWSMTEEQSLGGVGITRIPMAKS